MKVCNLLAIAAAAMLAVSASARAETKVELKGTHLCCGQCVKAVGDILKGVEGASGKCDTKNKTVTITAKDDETAQKALDALAAGGFHGDTGDKKLAIKDDSGAKPGKVKTLTLTEVHNCCGQCNTAIKNALKTVDGVKADTAKPKADSFEVTGDFDAEAVIKALNKAGYHAKVK
ncbi:MAG TPA: cation transporter [Gemmataceae bacterium]|jgi:copper chaperone CopZ|nr:cation transporter [Gemmataceae bacterium]